MYTRYKCDHSYASGPKAASRQESGCKHDSSSFEASCDAADKMLRTRSLSTPASSESSFSRQNLFSRQSKHFRAEKCAPKHYRVACNDRLVGFEASALVSSSCTLEPVNTLSPTCIGRNCVHRHEEGAFSFVHGAGGTVKTRKVA